MSDQSAPCRPGEGQAPDLSFLPEQLSRKLIDPVGSLLRFSTADMRYVEYVVDELAKSELLDEGDVKSLLAAVESAIAGGRADETAFACLFICFEWAFRQVLDKNARLSYWRRIIGIGSGAYDDDPMYAFACSRCYYVAGNVDEAKAEAWRAHELAPKHPGLVNNYAEMVIEQAEKCLLSPEGRRGIDGDEVRRACEAFDAIPQSSYYATHYIARGRLRACMGEYDRALDDLAKAEERVEEKFAAMSAKGDGGDHDSLAFNRAIMDYVERVSRITKARSLCAAYSNMDAIDGRLTARTAEQEGLALDLQGRLVDLRKRFDNERIDMLEFLGFFAGIISFVVAAVQMGDGLEFGPRVLAILVMLGALLVAFGSFSALLESGRSRDMDRASCLLIWRKCAPAIASGLVVIVLGVLLYAVL